MYHVLRELQVMGQFDACKRAVRDHPTPPEWRGAAWEESQAFDGPYEPLLPIDKIVRPKDAARAPRGSEFDRLAGRSYHQLYSRLVTIPKARLLAAADWTAAYDLPVALAAEGPQVVQAIFDEYRVAAKIAGGELGQGAVEDLRKSLEKCWGYEIGLFSGELRFRMNRSTSTAVTDFVSAIPLESEQLVDGTRMRLSGELRADGVVTSLPTIVEMKTGAIDPLLPRLAVAGYALAFESNSGSNVDVGCVLHLQMRADRLAPQLKCDIFPIDLTLRQTFIEWRNERMLDAQRGG